MIADATNTSERTQTRESVKVIHSLPKYGDTRRVEGEGYTYEAFFSARNERIRVITYEVTNYEALVQSLKVHALYHQTGKMFVKTHRRDVAMLKRLGLCEEARITGYFNSEDAVVMSLFTNAQRMIPTPDVEIREDIIKHAMAGDSASGHQRPLPGGLSCRIATPDDAADLSRVFAANFATYPFPVFDPEYVLESMQNDVVYMMIVEGPNIAAVASAETIPSLCNAEMTDFATMPRYRGNGLGSILLSELEKEMRLRDIVHLYTLSRASVVSINRIFGKAGYTYTGTLVQNCHISGDFEDMNCWCKPLSQ